MASTPSTMEEEEEQLWIAIQNSLIVNQPCGGNDSTEPCTSVFTPKYPKYICSRFSRTGKCRNGDDCKFRHIQKKDIKQKPECKFWLRGNCNSKNCKFIHSNPTKSKSNVESGIYQTLNLGTYQTLHLWIYQTLNG